MNKTVVGIGEILWDLLPTGKALGGAPANFAYHTSQLGCDGWAVSAIGKDDLGEEIVRKLFEKRLNNVIETVDKPTGRVLVTLDDTGTPSYEIVEDVAWDHIPFTPRMETLASKTDAVCFGTLVQRTRKSKETIRRFLSAMPTDSLKVFDINLRQQYYSKDIIEESLSFSDILKINDEEIDVISRMFEIPLGQEEACRKFLDQYGLKLVILTKGSKGSVVITEDQIIPQAAEKVKIVDTVGAGDAFTAAFVAAYLRGDSLADAQKLASVTAGKVCSRMGAM